MLKKATYALVLILLTASAGLAQSRTLYIGGIELRLGMPRDEAMKALTGKRYIVSVFGDDGNGFLIRKYDEPTKQYSILGNIGFDNNQLSYISKDMDTSAWPNDEGYAVSRAIYDALSGSIPLTDSDGAKRASARIVIVNHDAATPTRGNLRSIEVYINGQRIGINIWDGTDGKSVSAAISIQTKPW